MSELDEIDWASLDHAYGSAEDIPDQLRAIGDGDTGPFELFEWNLLHQGTVYSATAQAVPFLVGLIDQVPEILLWLQEVAQGKGYADVHRRMFPPELVETPAFQARLADELACVNATHAAVRAGLPEYRRFATHADPKVRAMAASLIAQLELPA